MDSKIVVNEWDRVKEILVVIDSQLNAFTGRQIRYYVDDSWSAVKLSVLMLPAKDGDQARMQQLTLSKIALVQQNYSAERIAEQFTHSWIMKLSNKKRAYEDLDVVLDSPPRWAIPKEQDERPST
jgi:hypothetical protein